MGRRFATALLAAGALGLLGAAAARGESTPTLVMRELPLAGARAPAGLAPPARFDLLGLHWRGAGTVAFRTHSLSGRWSRWRVSDTADGLHAGWRFGEPYWVGPSDRIEWRVSPGVRRLRAYE
ncbi:MAG: hypothetical protein QOG06_1437, partial [Gaiellaceae bacterium]|nr:hypothetical protein [Gaiellaceae bacterium]